MKKIQASEGLAILVEHGAEVDTKIKNLTYEDKAIKVKLADEASGLLGGDTSVRIAATNSAAVITAVEKLELDASIPEAEKVRDATRKGMLVGVVERKLSLVVPPGDVAKAWNILSAAGVLATLKEDLEVNPAGYREFVGMTHATPEAGSLVIALKTSVKKTISHRVKYEKA